MHDLTDRLAEAKGAVNLDQLEGFEENNGYVLSLIPVGRGLEVVPKWIRRRDDGKVGLQVGKDEEEPMYVTKLYAKPDYLGDHPVRTMVPWLKAMLTSSNGENHHVHTALLDLNEWGLQAEAKCYKCYTNALVQVLSKMQILESEEAFYREELSASVHCMEAMHIMDKLDHFQAAKEGEQVGRRSADGKRFKHGQGRPL